MNQVISEFGGVNEARIRAPPKRQAGTFWLPSQRRSPGSTSARCTLASFFRCCAPRQKTLRSCLEGSAASSREQPVVMPLTSNHFHPKQTFDISAVPPANCRPLLACCLLN